MRTFKTYLQAKGHSKLTIAGHFKNLCRYLNWCESEQIESELATANEVLSYIQSLQKRGVTQRTVQIHLGTLNHYYNWQIKLNKREDNPTKAIQVRGVKKRLLYHILSRQELDGLYNNYPANGLKGQRNRAIIGLLVYQGLTSADIARLQASNLNLRAGQIHIPGSRRSQARTLELQSVQILDLMEYSLQVRPQIIEQRGMNSQQLFISLGRSNQLQNTMSKLFKELNQQQPTVSASGVKLTNPKQIRASVITHWLKQYNLRQVQQMAGHRFVSSTEAYQINDLDALHSDIKKYHPID